MKLKWGIVVCLTVAVLTGSVFAEQVELSGSEMPTIKKIISSFGNPLWIITNEGEVYVSGENSGGILGIGNDYASIIKTPTRIETLKDIDIVDVIVGEDSYGDKYAYYLSENGKVFVAGDSQLMGLDYKTLDYRSHKINQLTSLKEVKVKKIFCNDDCTYFLTEEGKVYACGENNWGVLGFGYADWILEPSYIKALDNVKIKDIIVGGYKGSNDVAFFLTEDGEVYAGGLNENGELGLGHKNLVINLTKIKALDKLKIKSIEITTDEQSSLENVYYLAENGEVYMSGKNANSLSVVKIKGLTGKKVKAIKGNKFFLTEDNKLFYMNGNKVVEVSGSPVNHNITVKKIVSSDDGSVIFYITENGEVYSHGENEFGKLGLGHTKDVPLTGKAEKITALNGIKVNKIVISEDGSSTFFRTENGKIYAAGRNDQGRLGCEINYRSYGDPIPTEVTPKLLSISRSVDRIVSAGDSTWFYTTHRIYVAGNNSYGQLGLGHTEDVYKPTLIDTFYLESDKQDTTSTQTIPVGGISEDLTVYNIKTCYKCGEEVGREWYLNDNDIHYRACRNNHHFFDDTTKCKGDVCELCDEIVDKCPEKNCKGILIYGYEADQNNHWQKCTKGHKIEHKHVYSTVSPKVCTTCYYDKDAKRIKNDADLLQSSTSLTRCSICNSKTQWVQEETMHIMVCTSDSTHIMRIEGHTLDSNNKCVSCGKIVTKAYSVIFKDFKDKTHWGWRNVGNLVDLGIVVGDVDVDGERILVPNEYITAEAFIALLSRALGYDRVDKVSDDSVYCPISSTWSEGEWKYLMSYIAKNRPTYDAKKEMQIVLSNNSKSATDEEIARNYKHAITRERAAYLLGMFLDSSPRQNGLADTFVDWGEVTSAYKERLLRLSAYDILKGNLDNGRLYVDPTDPITRVQAIALIDRFRSLKEAGYTY